MVPVSRLAYNNWRNSTRMDIDQKIKAGYLLGCIRHKGHYNFYFMPMALWIINYSKYDPTYNPDDWDSIYRDNILTVTDDNVDSFMRAIDIDRINHEVLAGSNIEDIVFYIDFDTKLFVNGFVEISVEKYLPVGWQGKYDDPLNYLPNECRSFLAGSKIARL
jgi:hypothetical protein